jgi:ATP-binding cassette, subfamily B, bacterial MsbA
MRIHGLFGANPNLASIARRYLWASTAVACLATITGLLEGVGLSLLIPFLSTMSDSAVSKGRGALLLLARFAEGYSRGTRLLIIASAILGCVLLKNVLQILANGFAAWVDGHIGHDIRCALSDRLNRTGYAFFLVQDPARLVNILSSESWKASDAVRAVLARLAAVAATAVFGVFLLIVSWRLSMVVIAGGLVTRYVQKKGEARLRDLSRQTVSANQTLAERMLFTIFGSRLIRLFNEQNAEQNLFTSKSNDVRHAILKIEFLSGSLWPLLESLHVVLFFGVLLIAVFSGTSVPVLATFLVLMNRLQPHLRRLEQTGAALASAAGHLNEVEWLLNATAEEPAPASGDLPFHGLRDCIEFEDVSFRYRNAADLALRNANFVFRQGRSTALIGPSGAGKSTIINLVCRLLEPVSGAIIVDGVPLSELRLSDWLNAIAVAGQDIELIEGTIAENISYSRPALDRGKIELAVRSARADFIDALPDGLDSMVGPRGLSLSGGQRQRIGIARALAREPKILVLDEATNAIDHETETAIIEILKNLPKSITLIVVSHRPSTVAFCDDVIVVKDGRVIESGALSASASYHAMQTAAFHFPGSHSGPRDKVSDPVLMALAEPGAAL